MKRPSLEAQLALLLAVTLGGAAGLGVVLAQHLAEPLLALLLAFTAALLIALPLAHLLMRPATHRLAALNDGLRSLREGDYGLSITTGRRDELGALAEQYNALAEALRRARLSQHQQELLLDTVMQAAPQALVLCDDKERVLYSNLAAHALLGGGRSLVGYLWPDVLARVPEALREALRGGRDGLVSVTVEGETEIYQLSRSPFTLHAQPHHLHQVQRLTRELNRQEIATWKRVIRVISHELNNSLAPIASLAHTGRQLAAQGNLAPLDGALATIGERAQRLNQFLESYSRFTRLPPPQPQAVDWVPFLEQVQRTVPFQLSGAAPDEPGWFDRAQLEQALINLLKNAQESGSPAEAVELDLALDGRALRLRVLDRGSGLNDAVLGQALLPFYTTKPEGNGLGLALCREIIEAHGGRMALGNRAGGGAEVRLWLPRRPPTERPQRTD